MNRFRAALAGVLLAAVAAPALGITWGQPDGDAHPNVVAILFQRPDGLYSCTGTLLTPYVVLTAAHCTEEAGVVNIRTWVRNDPDIDAAIAKELGTYPNALAWLNDTWVSGDAIPHPLYNDFSQFPDTYDVGVVLLDEPIFVAEYGELPSLGQFDFLRTARGPIGKRSAVVVGYGLQGRIPAFGSDLWVRYQATSSVIGIGTSANGGTQNFVFTNNPGRGAGPGGTCSGDSGGPAFWIDPKTGETNVVMAVNSYSITPNCNGNDYQIRTDIAEVLNFVTPYLSYVPATTQAH